MKTRGQLNEALETKGQLQSGIVCIYVCICVQNVAIVVAVKVSCITLVKRYTMGN